MKKQTEELQFCDLLIVEQDHFRQSHSWRGQQHLEQQKSADHAVRSFLLPTAVEVNSWLQWLLGGCSIPQKIHLECHWSNPDTQGEDSTGVLHCMDLTHCGSPVTKRCWESETPQFCSHLSKVFQSSGYELMYLLLYCLDLDPLPPAWIFQLQCFPCRDHIRHEKEDYTLWLLPGNNWTQ